MTGSPLPLESVDDSRPPWLGGEAHVRHFRGHDHRTGRGGASMAYSRLALAIVFVAGGLLGASVTGLVWRAQRMRRIAQ
jgi:hypothetical protein